MTEVTKTKRIYNLKRSVPKPDDHVVVFKLHRALETITHVDMTSKMPPNYDQGELGSCVENAIAGLFEYDQILSGYVAFVLSRLALYYMVRAAEGTIREDSGSTIAEGINALVKNGACPEPLWPYDITKYKVKPPTKVYTTAKKLQGVCPS